MVISGVKFHGKYIPSEKILTGSVEGNMSYEAIISPSRYEKIESLSKYQSVNLPSKPLIGLPCALDINKGYTGG